MKKSIMIDYGYGTKSGMHEFLELARERNIVFPAFRIVNTKIIRFLNKLSKLGLPFFYYLILSDWKKNLSEIDSIVVTANYLTVGIVGFINKYFSQIDVHVYYFNIVEKDVPIDYFKKLDCQLWTFSKNDSEKYGMSYLLQPTCFENFERKKISDETLDYDVFFLGADKNRLRRLLKLKKYFEKNNLVTKYHIVDVFNEGKKNDYVYSPMISYHEYLSKAKKSLAILEMCQEGQDSITIRPIEAGFMKKKIITDDKRIVSHPFYRENNIFILGLSNNIFSFIHELPYDDSFDYSQFEIENWLKNFI